MRIVRFRVDSYKSFYSTGDIDLAPGFNVIVGQNNVGKTALVEALSLQVANKQHRSLRTAPTLQATILPNSQITVCLEVGRDELTELLKNELREFYVPIVPSPSPEVQTQRFEGALSERNIIEATFEAGGLLSASLVGYTFEEQSVMRLYKVDPSDGSMVQMSPPNDILFDPVNNFAGTLASILRGRIYRFSAERLNVTQSSIAADPVLASNASNLPQVLNLLQTSNPVRFRQFNQLVTTILPDVTQITAPYTPDNVVRIYVWTTDPDLQRDDLAIPLADSGTGIGQVLAILYVVLTSEFPRTIVIDEPQSFLHPGAVRKLLDILKHYQQHQHQYVITTHSPAVVTAADPKTLLLVRKKEAESIIESLNVEATQQLRLFLSEIGARLSDVFGADNILWVEGRTEEQCFPLILSRISGQPLLGTAILGVVNTGDFESRRSTTILDIYERLSTGRGLLPPAIGFIFDEEERSEQEREDLVRQSEGAVVFLPRRMYENYLLNPRAIAAVTSGIEGFHDDGSDTTEEEVERWLQGNGNENKYFGRRRIDGASWTDEEWLKNVRGAQILLDMFDQLSESRVRYDKIEHGVALTEWLVAHEPQALQEVAVLIESLLPKRQAP